MYSCLRIVSNNGLKNGYVDYRNGAIVIEGEIINLRERLASVEIVTSTDNEKRTYGGTLASGVLGYAILGPLGAIGGMLVGGKKDRVVSVTISCVLDDGRYFIVDGNADIFGTLNADCVTAQFFRKKAEYPSANNAHNIQRHVSNVAIANGSLDATLGADEVLCKRCFKVIKSAATVCRFCKRNRLN
jgi:hypothetical protein